MRIGKYEFDSREQSQTKIDSLGTATDEEVHPYGWATRAVGLDNEGSHSFFGVSYISNKM